MSILVRSLDGNDTTTNASPYGAQLNGGAGNDRLGRVDVAGSAHKAGRL